MNSKIVIRQEEKKDHKAVYEINRLAFGSNVEAVLVEKIRNSENFVPELSLIAEKDNKIIGHILFSRINIHTQNKIVTALSLAPMAVLPEFQRKGIGSKLVIQGCKQAEQLGYKIVVVVGHPEYYPRFGFIPARQKGLTVKWQVPDEAFMVYELSAGILEGISGTVEFPTFFDEAM